MIRARSILVSLLVASCTHEVPPPPSIEAPPPTTVAIPTPPAASATPALRRRERTAAAGTHRGEAATDLDRFTLLRNPTDPAHGAIFAADDDSCFYETSVAVPEGTFPPMGWRGRDRHPIDCPPEMDDPIWDGCAPGEVLENPGTHRCVCSAIAFVEGPDTPRSRIACPSR